MDKSDHSGILYVLPLALIIGITPMIVRYKKVELGKVASAFWIRGFNTDFFSYYKMWWFLIWVGLLLIVFLIYSRMSHIRQLRSKVGYRQSRILGLYYIFSSLYMIMAIISTALSECKYTSLFGFPDRYEGLPVLLGYMVVMLIAVHLINNQKQLQLVIGFFLFGAVIIALIGIFQFFEVDFLQSWLAQRLMIPGESFKQITSRLNFRFKGNNIIYTTLYNPNYAGSYFVMPLMISLILYLFSSNKIKMSLFGAISSLMFASWLGSLSRAGILGGLISVIIALIFLRRIILKYWKRVLLLTLIFLLIFTAMDYYTGGTLKEEFLSLGRETKLALTGKEVDFEGFRTEDKSLIIKTEDSRLTVRAASAKILQADNSTAEDKLSFSTAAGEKLVFNYDAKAGKIVFKDDQLRDKFPGFEFYFLDKFNLFKMVYKTSNNQNQAVFTIDKDGFWISGINDRYYKVEEVASWGFEGKEKFASKRGYIWSRTLPLLQDTIITGYGPDTYAIYFPQHDYSGKFKAFGTTHKIVDKPHNMYLQTAVNTGLISLLGLLLVFALYISRSLKLYWNHPFSNFFSQMGFGSMLAVVAYLIAGMFNDSVISVAPVFWTLLGLGIAINIRLDRARFFRRR